jgi:transcriptional regulator with XRE-family HTH domain
MAKAKLSSIRYQRGETQRDVAHGVGVTQATVYLWESGATRPRPAAARRLSDYFARPIAELLESETAAPNDRRPERRCRPKVHNES